MLANSLIAGPSPQVMIEMLPDDILLNVFRLCLDATPQFWPTLACVCQIWRQVVFTSTVGLNLRIYCTYGTPVLKTLDCWPALPIIVQYGGFLNLDPPAPDDDDNIIAALKQSGRISSISLTVTGSLNKKLSAITEPFSELEDLTLLSRDHMPLALPTTIQFGARLRTLHTTRVAFPFFPQLLSTCQNLVDLQLNEITSAGYFPPEAFANALSGMAQLETLLLHFHFLPHRRNYVSFPPQSRRLIVLPALTRLKYRGTSKYLDRLVARIDGPLLGDIDITLLGQPTMDASQLGRFIERIETLTLLSGAEIQISAQAISVTLSNPNIPTPLQLQILCEQLNWQLSCMAQVCDQFSPLLFRVKDLRINTNSSSGQDDVGDEQWLELIRSFGGAIAFWVDGELTTDILCALGPANGGNATDTTVLPVLRSLYAQEPMPVVSPFWDDAQSFITSREISGCPVDLYLLCDVCKTNFTGQEEFKAHLVEKHAYQIVCSHCGDFEVSEFNHLFLEHLTTEHPKVASTDHLISELQGSLTPSTFLSLLSQHSFLCAPEIHVPFATATAPNAFQFPGISTVSEIQGRDPSDPNVA
jgi:hypothetical protein